MGGLSQARLLLFGEWQVVILPGGEDLIADLWGTRGEGWRDAHSPHVQAIEHPFGVACEDLKANRFRPGAKCAGGGPGDGRCDFPKAGGREPWGDRGCAGGAGGG